MAIGRAMVDDEFWWMVRSDATRRTATAGLKTVELGACRCGGHDAGRHANASACLTIGAMVLVILTWAVLTSCPTAADVVEPNYEAQRTQMIRTIEAQVRDVSSAVGRDRLDPRILKAMGALPRHQFVPEDLRRVSYTDHPLPIGYGQTISQPLIVALMTDLLNVDATSVVLDVGTGSGYQAAVIAELARQVYTIEIIADLAHSAADRLHRLGYTNVTSRVGDGYFGWPDAAPFDGIIVTAAAAHIPPPLLQQLRPDGRMVIPVGPPLGLQHLTIVERSADGRIRTRQLFPVKFVPFTGQNP
jgi:protein-L-isoaspartate(D-aspartate) O-methyltransferase